MSITFRNYNPLKDFKLVSDFLIKHFQLDNRDGNWLEPAWDYMHSHPYLDKSALGRIGIWEEGREIVGVVHYESKLGEVFFETHPSHSHLKPEMLDYAEKKLYGIAENGRHFVKAYINDFDRGFEAIAQSRGYAKMPDISRPISQFAISKPFPEIKLPTGFCLKSLAEVDDLPAPMPACASHLPAAKAGADRLRQAGLRKIHRVLWRGFNHAGEPPEDGLAGRKQMQSAPGFRPDLNIVVEAPDGNLVSYSGQWYDAVNKICYVEPVATDPDYRRMGLGKAAVLEGVRRCGQLGVTAAYVGSSIDFYQAIGFKKLYASQCWVKYIQVKV